MDTFIHSHPTKIKKNCIFWTTLTLTILILLPTKGEGQAFSARYYNQDPRLILRLEDRVKDANLNDIENLRNFEAKKNLLLAEEEGELEEEDDEEEDELLDPQVVSDIEEAEKLKEEEQVPRFILKAEEPIVTPNANLNVILPETVAKVKQEVEGVGETAAQDVIFLRRGAVKDPRFHYYYHSQPSYDFHYHVHGGGNYFGHRESRESNNGVTGMYFVDLPNGLRQIVHYFADDTGYHPTITYEPTYTISSNSL